MVMQVSFMLPGKPQPKQRARMGKGGRWYTPKETRAFERSIKSAAHFRTLAYKALTGEPWPVDKANRYRLEVWCYMPDARRRDGDNVLKAVCDACNGVLWVDDAHVTSKTVTVEVDREDPRTEVKVEVIR